jgi:hypothetical protein
MAKHDKLFSRSLEHADLAKAFTQTHIPAHLKHLIDVGSISRVDRTNTNRDLSKHHRDIICATRCATTKSALLIKLGSPIYPIANKLVREW